MRHDRGDCDVLIREDSLCLALAAILSLSVSIEDLCAMKLITMAKASFSRVGGGFALYPLDFGSYARGSGQRKGYFAWRPLVLRAWVFGVFGAAFFFFSFVNQGIAGSAPEGFGDLVERVLPSVVNISTTQTVTADSSMRGFEELFREFFNRRGEGFPPRPQEREDVPQRKRNSLGSGFVIDPDGHIVTNHHVIGGADEIEVLLEDGRILPARLVGSDEKTDLALLKVESETPLPAARWGDSGALRIGDWVIAIGNPFGLGSTVTAGIVSAYQRDISAGPYDNFIQTDAAINRGNSGGPMFDRNGAVVGVNSAIFSPSGGSVGIGFSIPSNLARDIISQLRETGGVKRGWLGVTIQRVTQELAEGLELDRPRGALVSSLAGDGPAEEAGILPGDVILSFDGREVESSRRLPLIVAQTPIGKDVMIELWRQGKLMKIEVAIKRLRERQLADGHSLGDGLANGGQPLGAYGVELADISQELRARFSLPEDIHGVLVVRIRPGSSGGETGLRSGDVIAELNQESVNDLATMRSLLATRSQVERGKKRPILLRVLREGDNFLWIPLHLEDKSDK